MTQSVPLSRTVIDTGTATATAGALEDIPTTRPRGSMLVSVDFGDGGDMAVTTVTGQPWVESRRRPPCTVVGRVDPDDDEDALLDQVTAIVTNIVDGVGFDVVAHAPNDSNGVFLVEVGV